MTPITFIRRWLLLAMLVAGTAWASSDAVKVVYHFSAGLEQASDGLRNIRNHLAADPAARIVVVALGDGVSFLVSGTLDMKGQPYAPLVATLAGKGVEFRICETTLTNRAIDPKSIIPEATAVRSGVAEIARLQTREGYAYLKP
jgi:hypothetical protein